MTARRHAIPPAMCLGGRDLTEPRLDPSGQRLAFVSRVGRAAAVVVVDLTREPWLERHFTSVPPPAPGRGRGGGCLAWAPDGSALVYAADDGLWWQSVPGGPSDRLAAAPEGAALQAPFVAPDGSFVVYVLDQAAVWLVPVAGGPGAPRRLDDGRHEFCLDPVVSPDGRRVAYQAWSPPDMPWDGASIVSVDVATGEIVERSWPDAAGQQPRFAPDGTLLWVDDADGWLTVRRGDRPVVSGGDAGREHAEPTWGPGQSSFAVAPGGERVAIARNERAVGRLSVVDVASGAVVDVADGVHGSLSWRGDRLAALRSGPRTPVEVVVYDTSRWTGRVVAVGPLAGWDGAALVEPELVVVEADGASLHARWYRSEAGGGRRLLCWVHGGPTGQWLAEFLPRVAYWVGQGWDVLVPDPRGSTGHGRAYQQALRGEWGRLDVEDTAALLAAVQQRAGIGPGASVVVGGSSGGLTVLELLSGRHHRLVAGGIASYPVTDFVELAEHSHRYEAHYTDTLVAARWDVDELRRRSPLARAGSLARPLLLLHGTDDPVVASSGTIAYADAARRGGADVELHLFEGEGHGFSDPANQLREYDLMAAFLHRVVPGA